MKTWIVALSFLWSALGIADEVPNYAVIKHGKITYHTGLIKKKKDFAGLGETHVTIADCEGLPDSFDLREIGTVSPMRDQGSCGSCWSFSKTGSLESAILANGGTALDLSEQELVSCDTQQYGCQGGNLESKEYQVTHGQGLESDFPYTSGRTGRNGTCKNIAVKAKATQFVMAGSGNKVATEKDVMCALYKSHTVPWITVSASNAWGSPPASEKTAYSRCGRGQTNHAVGVVGWWKDSKGKYQFIMKNSWGTSWGDKGYMSLPLGCDSFGDEVAYVMTDAMPCKPPVFKLPAEISASKDVEVMLGVKEQAGVEYTWFDGEKEIGKGAMIYVLASEVEGKIYKLVGKTACGSAESSVRVKLVSIN